MERNPMRRIPWDILLALLAGLGLGLVYSWIISPIRVLDVEPAILRTDFKDQYRASIAAAYAATGNLPRAQARLALLGDPDPIQALNAQAQQMLASGDSFEKADQIAALALALNDNGTPAPTETQVVILPTLTEDHVAAVKPTASLPPAPPEIPIQLTETPVTPEIEPSQVVVIPATPRPSRTPVPAFGAPFKLTGQEIVCDPSLPDGLLQVLVYNTRRRQLPGIEIVIRWDGGEQQFFTGFKPEIGDGYADFIMSPNMTYAAQLARGSDIASGLAVPTCQAPNGETFTGGIELTFQQP